VVARVRRAHPGGLLLLLLLLGLLGRRQWLVSRRRLLQACWRL
jgi:hypothetical protein